MVVLRVGWCLYTIIFTKIRIFHSRAIFVNKYAQVVFYVKGTPLMCHIMCIPKLVYNITIMKWDDTSPFVKLSAVRIHSTGVYRRMYYNVN